MVKNRSSICAAWGLNELNICAEWNVKNILGSSEAAASEDVLAPSQPQPPPPQSQPTGPDLQMLLGCMEATGKHFLKRRHLNNIALTSPSPEKRRAVDAKVKEPIVEKASQPNASSPAKQEPHLVVTATQIQETVAASPAKVAASPESSRPPTEDKASPLVKAAASARVTMPPTSGRPIVMSSLQEALKAVADRGVLKSVVSDHSYHKKRAIVVGKRPQAPEKPSARQPWEKKVNLSFFSTILCFHLHAIGPKSFGSRYFLFQQIDAPLSIWILNFKALLAE